MPQVGPLEIMVILAVVLMVFGPKEMPKVARQAAKAWRQVQGFRADVASHLEGALAEDDDATRSPPSPTAALRTEVISSGAAASPPTDAHP